ncbi:MAG: rhodanese-related sulfurtransferase [Vigna little leaf phytoplasma]|nr:rhodanese-related sulfurtransferase [Vigna little leaf phytoplasma]
MSLSLNNYVVTSYYIYTYIDEPIEFRKKHFVFCQQLNLFGRVIVSHEGINGTLSGLCLNIYTYISQMKKDKRFSHVDFKVDLAYENVFPRLSVKVRDEIVTSKLFYDVKISRNLSSYLEPKMFNQFLKRDDIFLLDVRNNYEYELGHFAKAINPGIEHFRDLPQWLEKNLYLMKNKKILTYCTGGVRCEKIVLFLKDKGCEEVFQLEGGLIKYSQDEDVQGDLFEGKMYVFDKRISVPVNKKQHIIVGKDFFDQQPCERYINCANPKCNKQILCSKSNECKYLGSCSVECRKEPKNIYLIRSKSNTILE